VTPDQQRKGENPEKLQREQRERAREQFRRDFALLERYKSVAEIDAARDRELAPLATQIKNALKTIEDLRRDRKKLETEAEFYAGRVMPHGLHDALDANSARIALQEKIVTDKRAEMDRVNERFDGEVKRFLELTQPKPAQPRPLAPPIK
jgi:hypothetical protein